MLQTLAFLQLSHQSLQDTVHCSHQDVDKTVVALRSQLNTLQEQPLLPSMLITAPGPKSPVLLVTSTQALITSNTPEPNLKSTTLEAWNGTKCNAKPFHNRVLTSFSILSPFHIMCSIIWSTASLTQHCCAMPHGYHRVFVWWNLHHFLLWQWLYHSIEHGTASKSLDIYSRTLDCVLTLSQTTDVASSRYQRSTMLPPESPYYFS